MDRLVMLTLGTLFILHGAAMVGILIIANIYGTGDLPERLIVSTLCAGYAIGSGAMGFYLIKEA